MHGVNYVDKMYYKYVIFIGWLNQEDLNKMNADVRERRNKSLKNSLP